MALNTSTGIGGTWESSGTLMEGGVIGALPVTVTLAASNATSTDSVLVTAATTISTATSAATSTDSVALTATTRIPLSAANSTSTDSSSGPVVVTKIPLATSAATTSDQMALPVWMTMGVSAAISSDSCAVAIFGLQTAQGTSSATCALRATLTINALTVGTSTDSFTFASPIAGVTFVPLATSASTTTNFAAVSTVLRVMPDSATSTSTDSVVIYPGSVVFNPAFATSADAVVSLGPPRLTLTSNATSSDNIVLGTQFPVVLKLAATSTSSVSVLAVGFIIVGPASIYQLLPGIDLTTLKGATTSYGPYGQAFDVYNRLKAAIVFYPTGLTLFGLGGTSSSTGTVMQGATTGATPPPGQVQQVGPAQIMVAKYSWQDYGLMCYPTLLKQVQ